MTTMARGRCPFVNMLSGLLARGMPRIAVFAAMFLSNLSSAFPETLEDDFASPPNNCRPWVNWFWVDGNVTREGITADLEAMQRVGIGGALLMDVSQDLPPGPVRFGTEQWREMFRHTLSEASRLGL